MILGLGLKTRPGVALSQRPGAFFFNTHNSKHMINIDDRLLSQVDASEFWLLAHLAKRLNKTRTCWPSNRMLCRETGWSIDKLQKVKKSLIEKNLMQVVERKHPEGGQGSNMYLVTTSLIGVFVALNDLGELPEESDTPPVKSAPPTPTGLFETPPLKKPTTEVLTTEVLTNEPGVGSLKNTEKAVDIINKLNTIKERYGLKIGKKGEVNVTKERKAMIEARLKEFKQVTLQEVFDMLEHRCKVWKGTKFEKFIRVETLFQASKFMGYIEESVAQPDKDWTTVEQSNWEDQVTPNMTSGNQKYSGLW